MKKILVALGVALVLQPSTAAAAGSCTAATQMTSFTGYLSCQGAFAGNINGEPGSPNGQEVGLGGQLDAFGGDWAGDWGLVGKSDNADDGWLDGGPFMSSGNDFINFDGALTGRFVIGVKQSKFYSFYLYDWTGQTTAALNWQGTAPGKPGYSHINLYTVTGTNCLTNCEPNVVVPEPSSLAMMFAGLAGFGVFRRRRRNG